MRKERDVVIRPNRRGPPSPKDQITVRVTEEITLKGVVFKLMMTQAEVVAAIPCPKCGALSGQPCLSTTARSKAPHRMSTIHNERWQRSRMRLESTPAQEVSDGRSTDRARQGKQGKAASPQAKAKART